MKLPFGTGEEAASANPTSLMTGVLSAGETNSPEAESANDVDELAANSSFDLLPYSVRPSSEHHTRKIDFHDDDPSEMTMSRYLALKLMKKSWYYNPKPKDNEDKPGDIGSDGPVATAVEGDDDRIVHDFDKDISFEEPCLKTGWAYFEHQALYRFKLPKGYKAKKKHNIFKRIYRTLFKHSKKKFQRAEPGEDEFPTRLYPFLTPHNQLGDFGLGIGLYFSALRIMIYVMLICGFISIGNVLYFGGSEYDSSKSGITWYNFLHAGTAQCEDVAWVPCPECECAGFLYPGKEMLPGQRCATANKTVFPDVGNITGNATVGNITGNTTLGNLTVKAIVPTIEKLTFALKNNCDGTPWDVAVTNLATVVFILLSILGLGWYMEHEEVKFDEDEQTAQDYSVRIKNPPSNAHDPEEWRKFFREKFNGAQLKVCTCAVENDLLVKSLVKRRELIRQIHSLRPGESLHAVELAKASAQTERERAFMDHLKAKISPGIPELYFQLVTLRSKVQGLCQLEYPVTNVFLTFETEEAQRDVLEKLSNARMTPNKQYMFRGEFVLDAIEPEEPSTIRWQDLNAKFGTRLKLQLYTLLVTLVALVIVAVIILYLNQWSVIFGNYSISIFNSIFPLFARFMTDRFETHQTESQKQVSLYFKIVLFQWTNTVLIWFIILPFTDYLGAGKSGLLYRISNQFLSEIIISNVIAIADMPGHLKRHYLAPKATTQDSMNILFQGTPYDLADRYTDLTKLVFLCIFYSSLFPSSFFLCAIGLAVKYQTDKFNLLRTWKRAPALGPVISRVSRKYFFFIAVGLMAISSSYFWTGFPYDNLCKIHPEDMTDTNYTGDFTVEPMFPDFVKDIATKRSRDVFESIRNITLTSDHAEYRYCSMNFLSSDPIFPFVPGIARGGLDPNEYMTADQILSTTLFGWSAVVIVAVILLKFLWFWYLDFRRVQSYTPVGVSQKINYSDVDSRNAYIPQITSHMFAYPLVACKIDGLDEELFDFKDPARSYQYYDLTLDAKKLISKGHENDAKDPPGFTVVKCWGPND